MTTTTTYRPWRTRPTRPNHYPDEDRPRQPGRYPHKPHRHHTTWSTTTTRTTMRPTPRFRHRWTPPQRDDVPDKCDTSYDAISIIRREVFIFKGRVSSNGISKETRITRSYEKSFLLYLGTRYNNEPFLGAFVSPNYCKGEESRYSVFKGTTMSVSIQHFAFSFL